MSEVITIDRTIHSQILVKNMKSSETVLQSGIVLRSDRASSHGIRPRWAEVFIVGPDQHDVKPNDWVLLEHGRWSRKIEIETPEGPISVQLADPNGILLVSDVEPPIGDQYIPSNKV
jgi:hypothetical protein